MDGCDSSAAQPGQANIPHHPRAAWRILPEDVQALSRRRNANLHLSVQPARPPEGAVELVSAAAGGNNDHPVTSPTCARHGWLRWQ